MIFRQRFRSLFILLTTALIIWNCAGSQSGKDVLPLTTIESENLRIDSTISADPEMAKLIAPYQKDLNKKMSVVIGTAALDLKKGKPEAPLNNFVADLMRKRASREFGKTVDVALTNIGGLRVEIPAGPILLNKVYEVMPFENELVVVEMDGMKLLSLAKEIAEVGGEPISGMSMEIKDGALLSLQVGEEPVDNNKVYYLVTTDYLSSPGRNRFGILSEVPRHFLGVTLRDAIIDEIAEYEAEGKAVSAERDGRIIVR